MARPASVDLDIYLGVDYSAKIKLQSGGVGIDLTGRTYRAMIRETPGAVDPLLTFTVDSSLLSTGFVTLTLSHTQTGALVTPQMAGGKSEQICYWDLEQTAGGSVLFPCAGKATLIRNKTR